MARSIVGVVTSSKADKTIVITSHTRKTHPLYRKQYTVSTKFMAHDENNEAEAGDTVEIVECRPISARKRFTLSKIIEKPKLREGHLTAVKSTDSNKRASKSKITEESADKSSKEADSTEEKI